MRCSDVDLVNAWQAFFGELMLGETTDDAHPLRCWGAIDLFLQPSHRFGERRDAVPAQFHRVGQAAADDVHVAVDQSWDCAAPATVDDLRIRGGGGADIALRSNHQKASIADRHRLRLGTSAVKCGDPGIDQNEVGHGDDSLRVSEG